MYPMVLQAKDLDPADACFTVYNVADEEYCVRILLGPESEEQVNRMYPSKVFIPPQQIARKVMAKRATALLQANVFENFTTLMLIIERKLFLICEV